MKKILPFLGALIVGLASGAALAVKYDDVHEFAIITKARARTAYQAVQGTSTPAQWAALWPHSRAPHRLCLSQNGAEYRIDLWGRRDVTNIDAMSDGATVHGAPKGDLDAP